MTEQMGKKRIKVLGKPKDSTHLIETRSTMEGEPGHCAPPPGTTSLR